MPRHVFANATRSTVVAVIGVIPWHSADSVDSVDSAYSVANLNAAVDAKEPDAGES